MTDRDGAVRMISRYCDVTDYLDLLKKIMADGGYTGEKFAEAVKSVCGAEVEVILVSGEICHMLSIQKEKSMLYWSYHVQGCVTV